MYDINARRIEDYHSKRKEVDALGSAKHNGDLYAE